MLRQLHSLPGLIATLFVIIISVTGAILSLNPALERANALVPAKGKVSVAEFTSKLAEYYSEVEQVVRTPSGRLIVYYLQDGEVSIDQVNPYTGQAIAPYQPASSFSRWIKKLHRSLLLDSTGRAVVGITALIMLVITLSGVFLLVTRMGGWKKIFRPVSGTLSQRLHLELSRIAILGLFLSALTGVYLSATTFEFISEGLEGEPQRPQQISSTIPNPIDTFNVLKNTDLNDLRALVYPYADDPSAIYFLITSQGAGYLDSVKGEWLAYQPHDTTHRLYELIYSLHTGEGLWWLGLILGLAALTVPIMAITGTLIWWKRHNLKPKITANSRANVADSVILVGSENNTTWGFAKTLHKALVEAGQRVHTAPMNQLASHYAAAKHLYVFTATYGDGDAPASAKAFLTKLETITTKPEFFTTILGFGDHQFPQFCGFAKVVEAALQAKAWPQLLPLETINKQSPQAFARWGNALGKVLGNELALNYSPLQKKTTGLVLVERVNYGVEVQAPTAVLRFKASKNKLPPFEAGDLVGIQPPNNQAPRFYSLASASKDGVLEICVRHHVAGLCSSLLHQLPLGGSVEVFIQLNPAFRPTKGKTPIILIGAGTGIGPLVGFIRHNKKQRPMYLYWGGRSSESDFLYKPELHEYLTDKRLTALNAIFSRVNEYGNQHTQQTGYVQDKIALDSVKLSELIKKDAQILVCGGRNMANSVAAAINKILLPLGTDVAKLKAQGRYKEDVY